VAIQLADFNDCLVATLARRLEASLRSRDTVARFGGDELTVPLDVVEPMGMETMVFFKVNGTEVCARVEPSAAKGSGETIALRANLDQMHLIDPASNLVI